MFRSSPVPTSPVRSTLLTLTAVLLPWSALAVEAPVPVSPALEGGVAVVEARCPTFSWTSAPNRNGYELVVYRVAGNGDQLAVDAAPALSKRLPGAANSWTPSMEACLVGGERYAWSIRPLGADAEWSKPAIFAVASPPPTLEQVMAALRLETQPTPPPTRPGSLADNAATPVERPITAAATTGGPSFEVDSAGNVSATSFSGSGAGLSNVTAVSASTATALSANPANCAAGHAPLGITANGSAEGCYDVATQAELNSHDSFALAHQGLFLSTGGGTVNGGVNINGPLKWDCPFQVYPVLGALQMDRVGAWCIDASRRADLNATDSIVACHNLGMMLCPVEALQACDAANVGSPSILSCDSVTDGSTPRLTRTSSHSGTGNSFSTLLSYANNNALAEVDTNALMGYFCCLPVSP